MLLEARCLPYCSTFSHLGEVVHNSSGQKEDLEGTWSAPLIFVSWTQQMSAERGPERIILTTNLDPQVAGLYL